jgi:hypothetical protein
MKRAIVSLLFGYFLLSAFVIQTHAGTIGDFVWNDLNKNGIQDAGEPGLEGVQVLLFGNIPSPESITQNIGFELIGDDTTDANGLYMFEDLETGDYYVEFLAPDGFVFSPRDQGDNDAVDSDADSTGQTDIFSLDEGDSNPDIDAGLYEQVPSEVTQIGDVVWYDENLNGIQDEDETGIEGVVVNLYGCGQDCTAGTDDDVAVDSTTTDATGLYIFQDLTAGAYYVEFMAPEGYRFSPKDQGDDEEKDSDVDPVTGFTDCFDLDEGQSELRIDAGLFENRPPDCTSAYPSICKIWPPNHKYVKVRVLGVWDPDGDEVTITITGIFQDEPVDGKGDGRTSPDGKGVGCSTAKVRAERSGKLNGRVYHIQFTADDGYDGICTGEVTVGVPKSKGRKHRYPVDDGVLYDSTIDCDDYSLDDGSCSIKGKKKGKKGRRGK